jgi:hypothetical protein
MVLFRYYEIDDIVVREFLGKKLSSKHRKDLDEVSEKTSIAIKSCRLVLIIIYQISFMFIKICFKNKFDFRRQFDNVKRVFKAVEELQGSVIQNISSIFLLSEDLAKYVKMFIYIYIYIYILQYHQI